MTSEEWLNSKEVVNRSKKQYAHFDWRTDIGQQRSYISNPENIAKHGFYPFIHYEKRSIKYSKKKGVKEKVRDICYAAHIDRCVYQYYSFILNSLYNERVLQDGTAAVAVAYRTDLHENNIHFSKRVYDYIKANAPVHIMIGDFTGFFDNLDHDYLKKQWRSLLAVDRLPADHFAVFKNVTSYSKWELSDLLYLNNLEDTKSGRKELNNMGRILSPNQYKANRSHIQKNTSPFGIPQGSPISGILANMYMLDVDKKVNDAVNGLGGLYIRYSDDFMIVLPETDDIDAILQMHRLTEMIKEAPRLSLEPNKTQYFHFDNGSLVNCGKLFDPDADDSHKTVDFLGFSFDGHKIRIRAKTVSKYYYRMYRKARNIAKSGGYTPNGKKISCKNLYSAYSRKGDKESPGNFLTYVNRATEIYGTNEWIKQDTKNHMQKIRKALET